jgi:hypothetical protein
VTDQFYCIQWQSKVTGIKDRGSERMDHARALRALEDILRQPWAWVADFEIMPARPRKVEPEQRQRMLALDY